jgi:cell division septation protein DedD
MALGKSKLHIYDRKEIAILVLLGLMVAIFAFTLGIHLGKSVNHATLAGQPVDPQVADVAQDRIPERAEFSDQEKNIKDGADQALYDQLHDEVGKTGVKLAPGRQVDLPDESITETNGTKPVAAAKPAHAPAAIPIQQALPALERPHPLGVFTIQVGSFPTLDEAKARASMLDKAGLKPFVSFVDLSDIGRWYRVYVGGYADMDSAQNAGRRHKQAGVIDSFIVAKMPPKSSK